MSALNRGGQISEMDEACRPLQGDRRRQGAARRPDTAARLVRKLDEACRARGAARTRRRGGEASALGWTQVSCGRASTTCSRSACRATRIRGGWTPTSAASKSSQRGLVCRKEPVEYVEVPFGEPQAARVVLEGAGAGTCALHGAFRRSRRHQGDHLRGDRG